MDLHYHTTRDQTCGPALEVQSLNHWNAREVALFFNFNLLFVSFLKQFEAGKD